MSCERCGTVVPAGAGACPGCGAPSANAAAHAADATAGMIGNVTGRLARAAADASTRVADRVPGRSIAVVGYAVLLLAVALDVVPGSHGGRHTSFGWKASKLGHVWDVVIPALAGLALARRLTAKSEDDHPALPAAVALLAAAQAYLLLDLSLIPLLVLVAAAILVYDAARTGLLRAGLTAARQRLDAIPEKTTAGVAAVLAAVAISLLPGNPKSVLGGVLTFGSDVTGKWWGGLLLIGGVAAIVVAKRTDWWADWYVGGYVLVALAWAITLFNLSLVPLLWLAGATVAAYDRYQRAKERSGGALTLARLTEGTRRLVLVGVPLCVVAMSTTWYEITSAGYFSGGYESSYSSYYGGYVSSYSMTKYYNPGFHASNTGFATGPGEFRVGPLVVAALLAVLVAALWVSKRPVPAWGYVAPAALTGLVAVWWVLHLEKEFGVLAFAPGLAMVGLATVSVALPTVRARATNAPAASPAP